MEILTRFALAARTGWQRLGGKGVDRQLLWGFTAMRRNAKYLLPPIMIVATIWSSASQAFFFGLPRALKYHLAKIELDSPMLPPIGHSRFCLRYPDDCKVHGIDFRRRNIALTPERWNELNSVNRQVNRDIVASESPGNGTFEEWLIAPQVGDCKDYAITKRHELLQRGWPSRALLLSEVIVPDGEHHLILVVRTKEGDLVLDNLNANIRSVSMTYPEYQWVRVEMPQNPKFWASVRSPAAEMHVANTQSNQSYE
jgi:predicted transglutaminase-like cysteine proteinase